MEDEWDVSLNATLTICSSENDSVCMAWPSSIFNCNIQKNAIIDWFELKDEEKK